MTFLVLIGQTRRELSLGQHDDSHLKDTSVSLASGNANKSMHFELSRRERERERVHASRVPLGGLSGEGYSMLFIG